MSSKFNGTEFAFLASYAPEYCTLEELKGSKSKWIEQRVVPAFVGEFSYQDLDGQAMKKLKDVSVVILFVHLADFPSV